MKPISVYVSEETYRAFKRHAEAQGRPVAQLIREAMENYQADQLGPRQDLREIPTTPKPRLKRRWKRHEIHEELLG